MVHQLMTVQEKKKQTSCKSFLLLMKRVLRRIHTAVEVPQVQSIVSIIIHCDSQTLESLTTLSRPLITFRTTPCCVLKILKATSGGVEGDSRSVHTKGKGVGLSEI